MGLLLRAGKNTPEEATMTEGMCQVLCWTRSSLIPTIFRTFEDPPKFVGYISLLFTTLRIKTENYKTQEYVRKHTLP